MSDLVPPRPDLPAQDVSIPEMPAPERPLATWRWWEALLVYLLIMVVSAFAVLPIFQVIQPRGLANLTASAIIAIITVALLVLWLQRFHPGWTKVIGFPRRIWPEVRAGTGFGALLYPVVVFGVGIALNLLLEQVTGRTIRSPRQLPANLSAAAVAVAIAYSLVIAPIHEELFFRGVRAHPFRAGALLVRQRAPDGRHGVHGDRVGLVLSTAREHRGQHGRARDVQRDRVDAHPDSAVSSARM